MTKFRIPALAILGCGSLLGASFDCSRGVTPQEKAICANPELSRLDEQMAASYQALLAQLSPGAAAEVRQDQRDWIRWLPRVCPDHPDQPPREFTACLLNEYTEQAAAFKNAPTRAGGMTFFPRLKLVSLPNHTPPLPYARRFDFWTGRFSWPEIDRPTRQQAVWNDAVRARIDALQGVEEAEVDVTWTLRAANDAFISLDLEYSRYDYGAAHPNEETRSFNWWLRLARPLKADDVFLAGSGWEPALAAFAYQQLISGDHSKDVYGDAPSLPDVVVNIVRDASLWSLDSEGLTIEFPEYSVAPRVAGFLSAGVPWIRLRPYLGAGFNPAMLPPPLPAPIR